MDLHRQLYTAKELMELLSLKRSTFYRMLKREDFPKPVVIGDPTAKNGLVRWKREDIEDFINGLPREKDMSRVEE